MIGIDYQKNAEPTVRYNCGYFEFSGLQDVYKTLPKKRVGELLYMWMTH